MSDNPYLAEKSIIDTKDTPESIEEPGKNDNKPKPRPTCFALSSIVVLCWYTVNVFIFGNYLLGTLALIPIQRIWNKDTDGWIQTMKASVRYFESAKKDSTGEAASIIPMDWAYGKTTYSLYSSGLCREAEGLERVCYYGASPFYDFVKDMGLMTAQHLGVEDVEDFQQLWLNRIKKLVEDAFTEQERIKIHNEVFEENKAEDCMMKIMRYHMEHNGYGRAWMVQFGLFIVSFIVDISMAVALVTDVDKESLLLNVPMDVGIAVHVIRYAYACFLRSPNILPILDESLDGSSLLEALDTTICALEGIYLIPWVTFLNSFDSMLAWKKGRNFRWID